MCFTSQSLDASYSFSIGAQIFPLISQIEDGEIYASINQKDGMVCFHDNPEKYNNPVMLHKIDQEVRFFINANVRDGLQRACIT